MKMKTGIGMALLLVAGLGGLVRAEADDTKQAAPALYLEIDLRDGSRLVGTPVAIASIPIQTGYAKADVPLEQISSLSLEGGLEDVSLSLLNGDNLNGGIGLDSFGLKTIFGKVTIGIGDVRLLRGLPSGKGGLMMNLARNARVEVSQTAFGNGLPERVNDGVTDDVDEHESYWFSGDRAPQPDWIRLWFEQPAVVSAVRMLVPVGTMRFSNGHAPWDYEVIGYSRGQEVVLASVRNGEHPQREDGPIAGVEWIVVRLGEARVLEGVQLMCLRTSGVNYGPVVFEMEALGGR